MTDESLFPLVTTPSRSSAMEPSSTFSSLLSATAVLISLYASGAAAHFGHHDRTCSHKPPKPDEVRLHGSHGTSDTPTYFPFCHTVYGIVLVNDDPSDKIYVTQNNVRCRCHFSKVLSYMCKVAFR